MASTPILCDFVQRIASTGLAPFDFIALSSMELSAKTRIEIPNIAAAKMAAEMQRKSFIDPSYGANLLLDPNLYRNKTVKDGDLSLRFLKISSYTNDDTSSDRSNAMLAHAGPTELLDSEARFHEMLVLPSSIMLTLIIVAVYDRVRIDVADAYKHKSSYNVYLYFGALDFFLYMFTIVFGALQVIACNFAKLDDRLASHYLAIPFLLRFIDMISIVIAFILIGPWSAFAIVFGEDPKTGANMIPYYAYFGFLAFLYQIFCFGSIATTYIYLRTAYLPINAIEEEDSCGGGENLKKGFFSRLFSKISRFSQKSRIANLFAIGRYRRRESAIEMREEVIKEIGIRSFFGDNGGCNNNNSGGEAVAPPPMFLPPLTDSPPPPPSTEPRLQHPRQPVRMPPPTLKQQRNGGGP
jgi:hypothetical protein